MRLLEVDYYGEFSLTKDFIGVEIPEYAILSHTWGSDEEEVTYRDMIDGTGKNKVGYEKIRFCGKRARRDGLYNFWVDTCCINKSSDSELTEAINSMFRWYRKAAKCYVYLADVSTNDQIDTSLQHWEAAFENSRWFTRGWTLQELIAPPLVEFFCSNGNRLGNKKSLEWQLYEITGIPVSALQGNPLSEFSFDERILWAKIRKTKREEDKAYCLLGIFDISMPIIYGEGKKNAFRRLKREWEYQLEDLSTISQALPSSVSTPLHSLDHAHSNEPLQPHPTSRAGDSLAPNKAYLRYYDVRLTKEDVNTLKNDWLTDNIIAFWEEYIEREELLPKYPTAHIILLRPSMVFMLMLTPDPLTINGALPNFTRTTHIFLPINDTRNASVSKSGSHWSLLVVSVIDRVAFHYDSHPLSNFNRNESRQALDKICTLLRRSMKWINMDDSLQQENSSDCGVFVCIQMRYLLFHRLMRATGLEKVSMSMGEKLVDVSMARREIRKTIQAWREWEQR